MCSRNNKQERGVVLILFVSCLGLCMTFLVFAVDIARAYSERRKAQMVADVSSLSALNTLGDNVSYERVL